MAKYSQKPSKRPIALFSLLNEISLVTVLKKLISAFFH